MIILIISIMIINIISIMIIHIISIMIILLISIKIILLISIMIILMLSLMVICLSILQDGKMGGFLGTHLSLIFATLVTLGLFALAGVFVFFSLGAL